MKNLGVMHRIDDLGRIVIPKKIRRKLRIKEGMPIEIMVDENENIILTPYLTKAEKLEGWMDTILTIMDRDLCNITFFFHGSAIVCIREPYFSETVGIAVCSPNDDYNENIGKCIAYCRAADISIPDFLFED